MIRIAVVGDGPAGLSAALFLAKNGQRVTVYGRNESAMHYARVRNYLGIADIAGSEFQEHARAQAVDHGACLVEEEVTGCHRQGDSFVVRTTSGREDLADYVVLAAAKRGGALADALGVVVTDAGVQVDAEYQTVVDRVYAVGRLARPGRSQAIISAGAGAVAALDILAREAGRDLTDWESPAADRL